MAAESAKKFGDGLCFRGFSWHSNDPTIVERARPEMEKFLARGDHGGRKAVDSQGVKWLSDGIYLPWLVPGSYATGYRFYRAKLGGFAPGGGNSPAWRVVSHALGYASPQRGGGAPGDAHAVKRTSTEPPLKRMRQNKKAAGPLSCAAASSHGAASAGASSHGAPGDAPAEAAALGWRKGPLFCSCPGLKLITSAPDALSQSARRYKWVGAEALGSGTFGECFRATIGVEDVVVKIPRGGEHKDAAAEAYVLDRAAGHPRIVTLLDCCLFGPRYGLVFAPHGRDLRHWLRTRPQEFSPAAVREILAQALEGLAFLHDRVGVVHTDVKPANMLCVWEASGPNLRLADFGEAAEA